MDSKLAMEHGATNAEDAADTDTASEWLNQNSASSGPYILKSWVSESEVVLEANENYWQGRPYFDRVVIKHMPDTVAGFQQVQKGDIDVLMTPGYDQIAQAEADPNVNVEIPASLDINFMAMTCNPEISAPLSDVRVRQAIYHALDRDGMIDAALAGYGTKAPSLIPVGMPGVDPDKVPERDLEKARALLAEAGYADGFTEDLYYATRGYYELLATIVQSNLAEVGITVNLQPVDHGDLIGRLYSTELSWMILDWKPDYVGYTIWTDWWGFSDADFATNFHCQLPPELEEASSIIAQELDPEKRLQAVKDWQEYMMDISYGFTLIQSYARYFTHVDIQGFEYVPAGFDLWALHK
jgi:peptide/nickel transport system substrate-binding protein